MAKIMSKLKKKTHRLFIKIIDRKRASFVDELGRECVYTKWIEVARLNLGSVKKPSRRNIIEFRMIPIEECK